MSANSRHKPHGGCQNAVPDSRRQRPDVVPSETRWALPLCSVPEMPVLAASRMDEQGQSISISDCVRPVVGLGLAYCRIGERHVYISRSRTRDVRIFVPKGTRWYNLLRGALRKQQAQKSPYYGAFRDFRVLVRGQETIRWCGRRDSNSHTLRRQNLNLVCLPIPPRPQTSNENARQCLAFRNMGWTMGFEPTTAGATILCSTN